MKLDGEIRTYKFSAGTRLQEIIEEVLITSMYGRDLAEQLKDNDPIWLYKNGTELKQMYTQCPLIVK